MKFHIPKYAVALFAIMFFVLPIISHAQDGDMVPDQTEIVKARVVSITSEVKEVIPGTDTTGTYQTIEAQILEGLEKGKTISFTDDYLKLSAGDVFYLNHTIDAGTGRETYAEMDIYRLPTLILFAFIFVVLVLLIGGVQGLRGLLSLIGGFILILFVLLPAILHGYSPILVSIAVSSVIIVLGSYITHGFNRTTSSAVLGMILTVLATGALAYWAVHMGKFTGYGSEESVYITMNSRGSINLIGLLLGGIMIGVLGVLYDVAIGQAISVEELHHIAPHIPRKRIYSRALRIGREHIGALVNTLAIAYVGASLPLLLLFYQTSTSPIQIINKEIVSAEIIRILVGSIGLVLAVPITTFLAVLILVKVKTADDPSVLEKESETVDHFEHHH